MKQVLQDLASGRIVVIDVPQPALGPGRLLVRVRQIREGYPEGLRENRRV